MPAKLRLAQALGLLDDRSWFGTLDIPLRSLAPRHRVLARFVRDELLKNVWSFNWDCLFENALARVGLKRGEAAHNQPWLTRFSTIIVQEDFPKLSENHLFCILKPHGCVTALIEARQAFDSGDLPKARELAERFMITASELGAARYNATDKQFTTKMQEQLQAYPVMIIGWSISDPYLIALANEVVGLRLEKSIPEELTIVDIAFNNKGHTQIATQYGHTEATAFFKVSTKPSETNTDALLLWLQAIFCLDQLIAVSGRYPDLQVRLCAHRKTLSATVKNHLIVDWADEFLPAWTRLCWRGGLVPCQGFDPYELEIDRADEQIPWHVPEAIRRYDLEAGAFLLDRVLACPGNWDLKMFPGGFWNQAELRLVLPIPAWGNFNSLGALKPHVADLRMGYIERIDILPLTYDNAAVTVSTVDGIRRSLSQVIPLPQFADPANIMVASHAGPI
jgi:hypothetical protein